jgi:hypothetical protein
VVVVLLGVCVSSPWFVSNTATFMEFVIKGELTKFMVFLYLITGNLRWRVFQKCAKNAYIFYVALVAY